MNVIRNQTNKKYPSPKHAKEIHERRKQGEKKNIHLSKQCIADILWNLLQTSKKCSSILSIWKQNHNWNISLEAKTHVVNDSTSVVENKQNTTTTQRTLWLSLLGGWQNWEVLSELRPCLKGTNVFRNGSTDVHRTWCESVAVLSHLPHPLTAWGKATKLESDGVRGRRIGLLLG